MKKRLLTFLFLSSFLIFPTLAQEDVEENQLLSAATNPTNEEAFPEEFLEGEGRETSEETLEADRLGNQIVPIINIDEFVSIGQRTVFDASSTHLIDQEQYGEPVYYWEFGDGVRRWGEKVFRAFDKPGRHNVKLMVRQGSLPENRVFKTKSFSVVDKKAVLVSDRLSEINNIPAQAGRHGIWLLEIPFGQQDTGFSAEEDFVRRIQEQFDFVRESEAIIFQTSSASGLQSFAQLWRKLSEENKFDTKAKFWIQISNSSFDQTSKLLQPIFSVLKPKFILLTRPEALDPIFENIQNFDDLEEKLMTRGIDFRLIDERSSTSRFLIFSKLTTYFVSHGISQNVIYLLLAVPFLAFTISFFRQFVGISTFGVYSPLMLGLSFLVLGFKFGFLVFLMVLFVSYLIRRLFGKVEILYIPKISLLLSALALSFFLVLGLAVYFESTVNLTLAIFPMLMMATISEKFLSAQSEEGMQGAVIATAETVFVSLVGYFLVTWQALESQILALPEMVLLPILGNIWLGRFTGLRLSEYFRFRGLFKDDTSEEEE